MVARFKTSKFLSAFSFLVCLLTLSLDCYADPWGKDADMAYRSCDLKPCPKKTSLLTTFGDRCIAFHQNVISPADGPRSHFIPSSSQYTLDAMHKYGFFQGVAMGCDRLMRENSDPWVYKHTVDPLGNPIKWDPIP